MLFQRRPEKSDDFALSYFEVYVVERANMSEVLRQSGRLDHDVGHGRSITSPNWPQGPIAPERARHGSDSSICVNNRSSILLLACREAWAL